MVQVILGFLFTFNLFAMTPYHQELILGEHLIPNYEGSSKAFPLFHQYSGSVKFMDDEDKLKPLMKTINDQIVPLDSFLSNDFAVSSSCSNHDLAEQVHYLRYLFRLLALSYSYEALIHYQETLNSMGVTDHICLQKNLDLLKACRPKSLEMKKFLKRSGKVIEQYQFYLPQNHSYKKFTEEWISKYIHKQLSTPSMIRFKEYAKERVVLTLDDVKKGFEHFCKEDQAFFKMICDENDLLYGVSSALIGKELILNSNAKNVLNSSGKAQECTERFIKMSLDKENHYKVFEKMFFPLFTYINQNLPKRFIQGRLFLPGALKEFDDKGLKEFLYVEPEEKPTPIPTPLPTQIALVKQIPAPLQTVTPKVTVTIAPTSTPTPDLRSAFYLASLEIDKSKSDFINVDMIKFKKDYIFTEEILKKVTPIFSTYKTRQALEDLKEFDKLGTKEEPIRLIFLKYLIDHSEHQGLFNIKAVLGDRFYVQNDLDQFNDAKKPRWVHLNFSILDGGWKLILEKEPNTKKP
jgi:hypothetical protein